MVSQSRKAYASVTTKFNANVTQMFMFLFPVMMQYRKVLVTIEILCYNVIIHSYLSMDEKLIDLLGLGGEGWQVSKENENGYFANKRDSDSLFPSQIIN